MDEHLKRLEETPLFMRDLPDGDEEEGSESQAALEALKSLTFDGTPDGESSKKLLMSLGSFADI